MTVETTYSLQSSYNLINLPAQIKSGDTVKANYTYLSDGTKAAAYTSASAGRDYTGSFTYTRGSGGAKTLESVAFGGGRIRKTGTNTYAVDYYITDHLGSVRVIVNASGTIQEQSDYYPFGTRHPNGLPTLSANRWRFSGKEEQDAFGIPYSDFGARLYDRSAWTAIDPMAEKYYGFSPYSFCVGNPIKYKDPEGADVWTINPSGEIVHRESNEKTYLYYEDIDGNRTNQYIQISTPSILEGLEFVSDSTIKPKGEPYCSESTNANDIFKVFKFAADHSDKEWVVHRNKGVYTIGTVLSSRSAGSYEKYGLTKPDASIHSHPFTPLSEEAYSMGYGSNEWSTDQRNAINGLSPKFNYVYFPLSGNIYQVQPYEPLFIRKASSYKSFYWGTLNVK